MERVPQPDPRRGADGWTLKADSSGFTFRIADASLANNARTIFQRYLAAQVSPDSDLYGAELIFGELLGNVARHAPGAIDVKLRWNGPIAILEVADHGPGYAVDDVHLPGDYAESARGLFLVSSFGRDLAVRRQGGRTTTTVTLPVTRRRAQKYA
ncbi:MAG: putative anti-sigma regulatory factor, serine/threonine protein kinase [Candidatus Eremiobacteraeota bacterium]|nr:putative anti-sigma regulatory factor, serine/threonine protein kinase [Candidatus Eremiobacteraeota bacterium]